LPGISRRCRSGTGANAFLYVTDLSSLKIRKKRRVGGRGDWSRAPLARSGIHMVWTRRWTPGGTRPASNKSGTRSPRATAAEQPKPEFAVIGSGSTGLLGRIETPRNQTKPEHNAARPRRLPRGRGPAVRLTHRSNLSRSREAQQKGQAHQEGAYPSQAPAIQASEQGQRRAAIMRQRIVLPASRFQKYGSTPGAKVRKLPLSRSAPRQQAHTSLSLVELRCVGTAAACCRVNRFLCAAEGQPPVEASQEAKMTCRCALQRFAQEETVEETEESPVSALDELKIASAEAPFEFEKRSFFFRRYRKSW